MFTMKMLLRVTRHHVVNDKHNYSLVVRHSAFGSLSHIKTSEIPLSIGWCGWWMIIILLVLLEHTHTHTHILFRIHCSLVGTNLFNTNASMKTERCLKLWGAGEIPKWGLDSFAYFSCVAVIVHNKINTLDTLLLRSAVLFSLLLLLFLAATITTTIRQTNFPVT